jgi:hypothetical protein
LADSAFCKIFATFELKEEKEREPRRDTDTHGSESDLSEAVTGSAFEVANRGAGLLEKALSGL